MMKALTMSLLVAGQIALAAQPAVAAELGDAPAMESARQGAFAGARLRVPLDGAGARKTKASLAVAPIVQGRRTDGSMRTRFGEGMELRLTGEAKPRLAIGGRSIAQLKEGRTGPDGRKAGISTIGWVAIGVGVAAVAVFTLFESCKNGDICGSDNDG
jgi:hypothetical protein